MEMARTGMCRIECAASRAEVSIFAYILLCHIQSSAGVAPSMQTRRCKCKPEGLLEALLQNKILYIHDNGMKRDQ